MNGFAVTRIFDAAREHVWREWTAPEAFADWFGGPAVRVSLDSVAMDVRPGGSWRLTMQHSGREIHWTGDYREVEPPARLVFTINDQPGDGPRDVCTLTLSDLGDGRTQMHFDFPGERDSVALGTLIVAERLTTQPPGSGAVRVRRFVYQYDWQPAVALARARVRIRSACTVPHAGGCGRDRRSSTIGAAGRSPERSLKLTLPRRPGNRLQSATNAHSLAFNADGLPALGALRGELPSPTMRGHRNTWVFPAFTPTIEFPAARMPAIVAHMTASQQAGKPGAPGGAPLQRVTRRVQLRNRELACGRVRAQWAAEGFSCEEYPFASTRQGGAEALIAKVPPPEQNIQGGTLSAFYRDQQVRPSDRFWSTAAP